MLKFKPVERVSSYQFVRNSKGALVKGKKTTVCNDLPPRTVGGLIKAAFYEKGVELKINKRGNK